ncbi:L-lactate permease [Roseovarius sp. SCSIO 43702]|nr:L-lactate permease [Roseovarius sp. SCSIO 43702]QYX56438.1 L-lactate permease [Roseovarius sp. SCSIO 43702]
MTDLQIPIDLLNWGFALLPILVLMILMVLLNWTAPQAGMFGMFTAAAVSLLVFQTPLETLAVGGAKGVWDALFILYVVWPALLLYQVTDQAGGYEALRQGITRFSRNELFVVLALGWVFSSFLQGIAGFGTPIAVVAPLLVALGVRPVYAVAIPIIAHVWAKFFGTLAVGWLATLQVVDLADPTEVAFQTGLLLIIPVVLGGFTVVWMYGRGPALRHAWPLVLIISAIHGGGQAIITLVDPVLSTFIPATLALLALYPLSRWKRYATMPDTITDRPAMRGERKDEQAETEAPMGFAMSFVPYVLLTVLTIGALVIEPLNRALGAFSVGLPFPEVTTGYGIVREAVAPYSPFSPLTHPGTFLMITAAITWAVFRARGVLRGAGPRRRRGPRQPFGPAGSSGGRHPRVGPGDRVPGDGPDHEPFGAERCAGPGHRGGGTGHGLCLPVRQHRGAGGIHDLEQHLVQRIVLGFAAIRGRVEGPARSRYHRRAIVRRRDRQRHRPRQRGARRQHGRHRRAGRRDHSQDLALDHCSGCSDRGGNHAACVADTVRREVIRS